MQTDRRKIAAYTRLSEDALLYLISMYDQTPLHELSIEEARAAMRREQKAVFQDYDVTVATIDTSYCAVYLIRPRFTAAELPATFYLHGGGWILGDISTHTRIVCELALRSGSAVAFIEYPLAPQHKFPEPLEACYGAILEILHRAGEWNLDADRYCIVGDSSGGNLAAAFSLLVAQRGEAKPLAQVLLYPPLAYSFATESYSNFEHDPNLGLPTMRWFWQNYLGEDSQGNDPLASPLSADPRLLRMMPPTFLLSCEYDVLRCEVEDFAGRLLGANVQVVALRWLGALHGFLVDERLARTPDADACLDCIANYIRQTYKSAQLRTHAKDAGAV